MASLETKIEERVPPLSVTLRNQNLTLSIVSSGSDATIHLDGELDAASATLLDNRLRIEESSGLTSLTIDLSGLGFIDSSGLGAVVSAARRASMGGWAFRVVGAQGSVRRTFDAGRIDDIFRYLNRLHQS